MAQKQTAAPTGSAGQAADRLDEVTELLGKVGRLLTEGQPGKALELAARAKLASPLVVNAMGVCQLRLGNFAVAVDIFRGLVLSQGGVLLRPDVPVAFKTNYAAALIASGKVAGGQAVLAEVRNEPHPAVGHLREAVRSWVAHLPLWSRVNWYMGGEPEVPVTFTFPLGDLE